MIRPQFVGREPELATIADCLAQALSGQPRVVLCRGEAGIGKTWLAEQLLLWARGEGALGVWGAADDAAGLPPFWPWSRAFRAIGHTLDLARIASERGLTADLARVAPEMFADAEVSAAAHESVDNRVRQFDAVAQMLRWICHQTPLVIVLEDAHWADESSLRLLAHVVRGLTDERLLLMVNARDLEQRSAQPLSQLVRQPCVTILELGGLSEPDVRRQLTNVLERPVGDAELAHAYARTRGNPFLVQEAGRALASGSGDPATGVTPTLRDAIASRLEHLSPLSARVIESASVLGHEFAPALLATMVDLPPLDCLAALDEAQRGGLVEPSAGGGEFRFVHALVRDAIEADLSRADVVHLHHLAAEAIVRHYPDASGRYLFELARHSAESALESNPAAAHWSERAAEEAQRQLAYEDAARLYGQALRVGGSALGDEHRCRLLLAEAAALNLAGDLGGRLKSALEASAIARTIQRPDLLASAALVMEATGSPGFDIVTRRLCQEALAGLDEHAISLRSRTMARFAETFIYLSDAEPAEQASRQALELAELCQDPLALASALGARHVVCAGPEGLEVRAQLAENMLALSHRTADPNIEFSALRWRIDVWFERGDLGRITSGLDALERCAREIDGPVARFIVLHTRAALAQAQARFADARQLIDEAFSVLAASDHAQRFYARAALLGFVGHHVGQDASTLRATGLGDAPASETLVNAPLIGPIAHAHALAEAGRLEEAAHLYQSLGPVAAWRPPPHAVLLVHALGIRLATALSQTADVGALRSGLLPYRGHHVVSGIGALSYFGPVELWLGVAACYLGLLDEAVADLEQAEHICRASGAVGFHVESMCELAAALLRRGGEEDARRTRLLLAEAAPRAAKLGMQPLATRISALAEQVGSGNGLPLSPRELEVAQLVADGLTNRQISQRLVISERTAQNHVQHILTRLGLANRSQIARLIASRK